MDPEDIKKGRIFTWTVILMECFFAFCIMIWLVNMDRGTLDTAEMNKLPVEEQQFMRANWKTVNQANIAGPILFVVVLGLCLALLGGNWWIRICTGLILIVFAAATMAAPWICPPVILQPKAPAILAAGFLAFVHLAGGVLLLFAPPVKYFLHPRRMIYATVPQTR